ncbi:MAG: group II intron reverse transcriptase/maturase, partial [Candidatus Binatia bacterium]
MMYGSGKSDRPIGPEKPPNKAVGPAAEAVEERGLAEGNLRQQTRHRTQGRESLQNALERIREAAKRDGKMRFTALLHHIYDIGRLRAAFYGLKREAVPGIDGETWKHYGETLEDNLRDLSGRLQ